MLAGTGALISVHTSNLANALFLPPGAAVFEILQRNWAWEGTSGGSTNLHNSARTDMSSTGSTTLQIGLPGCGR